MSVAPAHADRLSDELEHWLNDEASEKGVGDWIKASLANLKAKVEKGS